MKININNVGNEMNIIYVIDQPVEGGLTSGIIHKIQGKIKHWKKQGVSVSIISLYDFKIYDESLKLIDSSYSFNLGKHSKIRTLLRLIISTLKLVIHRDKLSCDILYMRTRLYTPLIGLALQNQRVVFELNSDDINEFRALKYYMYLYNLITRNLFYYNAHAFVAVSKEIKERFQNFKKKIIVIANGIELDGFEFLEETNNSKPRLCFIGSPGFPWHGTDRLLKIAKAIPEYDFDVIGINGEDTDNLKYHGYLKSDIAQKIVSKCDVGISSLALFRNNMNEASPLKSRQYFAQGLPIICAYNDTDFNEDEEFTCKISNSDDVLDSDIRKIKSFVKESYGNKELRKSVRSFAVKALSNDKKELKRINFLKGLL